MGKPMAGFFSIEEAFRFNFMGNHATKIFHRNGDPTTNEWAIRPVALRGFFNRGETIEDVFVNLSSDLETILGQSRLDSNAEKLIACIGGLILFRAALLASSKTKDDPTQGALSPEGDRP
jgi:hypothetical protein